MTSWGTNQSSLVITTVLGWVPVTACWTLSSILTEQKANRETGRGGGKKKKEKEKKWVCNDFASRLMERLQKCQHLYLCSVPLASPFFFFSFFFLPSFSAEVEVIRTLRTWHMPTNGESRQDGMREKRREKERREGTGKGWGRWGGCSTRQEGRSLPRLGICPQGAGLIAGQGWWGALREVGGETDVKALNWVCLGCELAHSTNGVEGSPGVERRKLMPQHQQPELG